MSEVKRLTKADILQGNKNVYYEYFEKIEGELPLKSLTDGQASQIESVRSRGSRMNGTPVMGKDGNPDHEKSKMNLDVDLEIGQFVLKRLLDRYTFVRNMVSERNCRFVLSGLLWIG